MAIRDSPYWDDFDFQSTPFSLGRTGDAIQPISGSLPKRGGTCRSVPVA